MFSTTDPATTSLFGADAPLNANYTDDAVCIVGDSAAPRAQPFFEPHTRWARDVRPGQANPQCCAALDACNTVQPDEVAVPAHWLDAGEGWATRYFTDVVPTSVADRAAGSHRCTLAGAGGKPCEHVVDGEAFCADYFTACWHPAGNAPSDMAAHLKAAHGLEPPARTAEWATGLFDSEALCYNTLCAPCSGARQVMAARGLRDRPHVGHCALYALGYGHPEVPCLGMQAAACTARHGAAQLEGIAENGCATCLIGTFLPACSLAQSWRQFAHAGVWPGGMCGVPQDTSAKAAPALPPMQ
jgi:hypothetical protein